MSASPNSGLLRRAARRERIGLLSLVSPAFILVTFIMVLPVAWLFYLSVLSDAGTFSLEHYRHIWDQPSYARTLWTTFKVSLLTTGICILLGYPLAYLLSELPKRAANLCMIAVLLPLWTSLLVRTYAWLVLLQHRGLINNWGMRLGLWSQPLELVHNLTGTLIGMVHVMLPFIVLPLYAGMRSINRDYLKAAANLGASPTKAFWLIHVPLSRKGLATGSLGVFILCLGFYITPLLLGGGRVIVLSNRIADDIEIFFSWGSASALGVVLLTLMLILLFTATRVIRLGEVLRGRIFS
jgi:putative spermidine/putrescine transport system permease protein/spermidine/putrescine transport system permease protein